MTLTQRFTLREGSASSHPCCFSASIFLEMVDESGLVVKDYLYAEALDMNYGEQIVAALNSRLAAWVTPK